MTIATMIIDGTDRVALEREILKTLNEGDTKNAAHGDAAAAGVDSRHFAETRVKGGMTAHAAVLSACRSLASAEMVAIKVRKMRRRITRCPPAHVHERTFTAPLLTCANNQTHTHTHTHTHTVLHTTMTAATRPAGG